MQERGLMLDAEGVESADSGTEYEINMPPSIPMDTLAELDKVIEDFGHTVEIFDWENFQQDLDDMDF